MPGGCCPSDTRAAVHAPPILDDVTRVAKGATLAAPVRPSNELRAFGSRILRRCMVDIRCMNSALSMSSSHDSFERASAPCLGHRLRLNDGPFCLSRSRSSFRYGVWSTESDSDNPLPASLSERHESPLRQQRRRFHKSRRQIGRADMGGGKRAGEVGKEGRARRRARDGDARLHIASREQRW